MNETEFHIDPFTYRRRKTRVVMVGDVAVGGDNPIRVQSMTTTPTMDTGATVAQVKRLADVGCEIARITAPTVNEARNLEHIKNDLLKAGYTIPLVADIHFRPDAAMVAADFVEKVRVNPGNFVDGKAFKIREYTDEQYQDELTRLDEKFTPLVLKLKKLKRSLRIGTNHGSLSDRIMNRFGDTPLGMVESALEFVRLCRTNDYHDVIFSMKASNPKVMIESYRLLAERLALEGMDYPFHLGVTEAGGGEDGRIKSAIGIGSLLEDGIGDTIRVSLTEDPEFEVPVAQEIAKRYRGDQITTHNLQIRNSNQISNSKVQNGGTRRDTGVIKTGPFEVGGTSPIRIVSRLSLDETSAARVLALMEERVKKDTPPEILEIDYTGPAFDQKFSQFQFQLSQETQRLSLWVAFQAGGVPPRVEIKADGFVYRAEHVTDDLELARLRQVCETQKVPLVLLSSDVKALLALVLKNKNENIPYLVGLEGAAAQNVYATRLLAASLKENNLKVPILLTSGAECIIDTSVVMGSLICDGIGDAVRVLNGSLSSSNLDFAYNLLQGCGNRITKTEFVSCPSCGRTLFDLQSTTERIKAKTGHLKGIKIAIMGCIVNGPGEMADADFGYVGGGPGKINLYVGKQCVEKSIPSDIADQKLVDLIKAQGKWVDPVDEFKK